MKIIGTTESGFLVDLKPEEVRDLTSYRKNTVTDAIIRVGDEFDVSKINEDARVVTTWLHNDAERAAGFISGALRKVEELRERLGEMR